MSSERKWLTQIEIDERACRRIGAKLSALIRTYDGSAKAAREILRGLVAARRMQMDLGPFEDLLARRHSALEKAAA